MVRIVFETFREQLEKAACQLSSQRDVSFSPSNLCIVDHVILIIYKRVEYWKKVQKDHQIPWSIDENTQKVSEIAIQQVEAILKELIWNLQHFGDKLKMDDITQKQLELAQMISSLLTDRKLDYLKVFKKMNYPIRFAFDNFS